MVKSKKVKKKSIKKDKNAKKIEIAEKNESGASIDDAFTDDSDVVYAPTKPRKEMKLGLSNKEIENELDGAEEEAEEIGEKINGEGEIGQREVTFKTSKPIAKIKKGDKIKIDGLEYEVDSHYILIDHGSTKEMAIEIFNPKTDKDFQLRYFDDQVESTLDLYELQEILYVKKPFMKIEW